MSDKVKMICSNCGSTNVWKDANARWNETTQKWELLNTFDNDYCEDCDGECSLDEKPLEPTPAPPLPNPYDGLGLASKE